MTDTQKAGAGAEDRKVAAKHSDEAADIFVRADHIVEVRLKSREYNKTLVNDIITRIKKLTASNPQLMLVIASDDSMVTLDGVKSLFSKESVSYPMAKAYVIKRKSHFVLARVCMLLYKPVTPIRFFEDELKAEEWLKSLILPEDDTDQ